MIHDSSLPATRAALVDRAVLVDRGVLAVGGPEARALLQRLITSDVEHLAAGAARYGALLSPQGKIVADFLVVAMPGDEGFLIDAPAALAADLARKLILYRLRAKVTIVDRSADLGVVAFGDGPEPEGLVATYDDPRDPALWRRGIGPRQALAALEAEAGRAAYKTRRIHAGVPEGGVDFAYGETFPHDANLDHLHGVDFRKGCYVGQEVVSRVEHRGTARKRIVHVAFEGPPPRVGADVMMGDIAIGTMGSSVDGLGLAMVRLDRAAAGSDPIAVGDLTLRLRPPAWA